MKPRNRTAGLYLFHPLEAYAILPATAPMKSARPRFVSTPAADHRFAGGDHDSAWRNITEIKERSWTFSDLVLGLCADFWKFSDFAAEGRAKFGKADQATAAANGFCWHTLFALMERASSMREM